MTTSGLRQVLERFFPLGFAYSGELLLHRDDALRLVDELEQFGVVIDGVSMWYPVEGGVVELPGSWATEADDVSQSADDIRRFLQEPLPDRVEWVSLVFEGGFEAVHEIQREREGH